MRLVLASALAVTMLVAPAQPLRGGRQATGPATGTSGMVSTAHPLATRAGLDVLTSGGNAFDAAVAVAAALNVVEPQNSGLGGYGTILVYHAASRRMRFLNASSRIPRGVDADAYREPTPGFMENRTGAKAVSTPGNLHAWEAMSRSYGTRRWNTLFEPAIRFAEEGFPVSARLARTIGRAFADFSPYSAAFYGRNGAPLAAGDTLVQRDLARTLRQIAARGAGAFYGGDLGQAIDSVMRASGGFLALDDLRRDRAEWYDAISIEYRGHTVWTAPPPANAFDALARLGMMASFDGPALGHNSAGYLHRYAEVTKLGFWMRLRYAGDPEVSAPPVAHLLSRGYLDSLVARIDTARAWRYAAPGNTTAGTPESHTTHFVIADRWGNVVSATQTLGNEFGSRIMPQGTGIWLNNSLAYATFEPKGNPMDAFPGRHKLSGDVPVIVTRAGRPWLAVGTPGGHGIGQTVPQMVMNVLDFGMDVQAALAAPRISFSERDGIIVEPGVAPAVRAELVARGHLVRVADNPSLGNAHGLTIAYDAQGRPARFTGGADPRGEGLARGY